MKMEELLNTLIFLLMYVYPSIYNERAFEACNKVMLAQNIVMTKTLGKVVDYDIPSPNLIAYISIKVYIYIYI